VAQLGDRQVWGAARTRQHDRTRLRAGMTPSRPHNHIAALVSELVAEWACLGRVLVILVSVCVFFAGGGVERLRVSVVDTGAASSAAVDATRGVAVREFHICGAGRRGGHTRNIMPKD
jgi:hypothetical protein